MFSLIKILIIAFLAVAFLAASIFGTTLGLPLQSFALISLALAGLLSALFCFEKKSLPVPYLLLGVVLVLSYFGIRAHFSPVADFGVDDLFLILGAGLLYLIGGYACGSPHARLAIAYSVLLALCLNVSSAVMQIGGGEGVWPFQWFADVTRPGGSLITGMYGYRGSFANFAAIGSMLSLSLALLGRYHGFVRLLWLALAALGFVGVAMSSSRSAIISLVVGGLVFACLLWVTSSAQKEGRKKHFRWIVIGLGALVLIGGPYVAYGVFSKRISSEEVGIDVFFADSSRSGYWPMALSQISDHPWIGAGSRSFSYENFQHWNPNLRKQSGSPEFVHNEYLQAATDYGLVGLLLVLIIIGVHLLIGARRTSSITAKMKDHGVSSSNELALCVAGVVGITVMAVHVIFDFRTHFQANLLLVTCCLLWVLPVRKVVEAGKKGWFLKSVFSVILLGLSFFTTSLAVKELNAGLPLLNAKLAFETSSWDVRKISEDSKIQALRESIELSPSYRRHLKLGTIYHARSEEEGLSVDAKIDFLNKAYDQYQLAAKRHPYNPVIYVNLGSICGQLQRYSEAESYFEKVLALSGARGEVLFETPIKRSNVFYQKALVHWGASEPELAEKAFMKAYQIIDAPDVHEGKKRRQELTIASGHLKFLAASGEFTAADTLIKQRSLDKVNYRVPLTRMHLAEHYYTEGIHLWSQRRPEEAMRSFLVAKNNYLRHKREVKGEVGDRWLDGFKIIEERLAFFKGANIKPTPQD